MITKKESMENMKENMKDNIGRTEQSQSRVLKAGFGYTIGNYLLKGLSFFTIPIFTLQRIRQMVDET